jgi:hypothetical protein
MVPPRNFNIADLLSKGTVRYRASLQEAYRDSLIPAELALPAAVLAMVNRWALNMPKISRSSASTMRAIRDLPGMSSS